MAQGIFPVTMPKWGIEMTEGTINQWSAREGQAVGKGDPLLEVETEKIVNAVEAPASGTLRRIVAPAGETRPVGSLIAVLAEPQLSDEEIESFIAGFKGATVSFEPDEVSASSASPSPSVSMPQAGADTDRGGSAPASEYSRPAVPDSDRAVGEAAEDVRVSPVARRLAERLGVNLSKVQGTGRNGRISKEDIEAYAARMPAGQSAVGSSGAAATSANHSTPASAPAGVAASPLPDAEANSPIRLKMSAMRSTIARRLLESKQSIPHYRLAIDADVSSLLSRRRELGPREGEVKITVNDMLVRACALALVRHPMVNAQLEGDEVLQFPHADIAIAVATDNGLITPIVRSADLKSLPEIARTTAELTERARRGGLAREEFTGGSFTISNLGMYGLAHFDAIINPPQVAILAVGAAQERVGVRDGAAVVTQAMTLTLSADHRVVDGAVGAAFLATLRELVEQPTQL